MPSLPLEDLAPQIVALKNALEAAPAGAPVAVCAHTRPDGDAIGSVCALSAALRHAGFEVCALLADSGGKVPQAYRWLPEAERFLRPNQVDADTVFELFIALDAPEVFRLGDAQDLCAQAKKRALIDHHPVRAPYAELVIACTQAAATGQLIWEILPDLGLLRGQEVAVATYVALVSDTGRFAFTNTNAAALSDAAAMVAAGADAAQVAQKLYSEKPLAALQLEELIVSRLTLENDGAVVASYYDDDDLKRLKVSHDWTENLIDLIRVVKGTRAAVMITHTAKGGRVSLRSAGAVNVGEIAVRFGGGGHAAAAGIIWPDPAASREEILAALLPLLPSGDTQ